MSTVLWPRQEVLQLVIPQLGVVGKTLDNATAINAVKQLSKYQTVEGKIRYLTFYLCTTDGSDGFSLVLIGG